MKITISIILGLFLYTVPSYGQFKALPLNKMYSQQNKSLFCLDSLCMVSKFCSLSLDGFAINLFKIYVNENERELQIIGRVCVSNNGNSSGIAGVEVFKAVRVGDTLTNRKVLGETTYGGKYLNNDGFFDITLRVDQGESLFFYSNRYFLQQFTVFKLLYENR